MKIRAVMTATALLLLAACGSEPGTPTASSGSGGDMTSISAPSSDDGGAMSDATSDDTATMDDSATESDDGAVDQGGVDQPGADDSTDSSGAAAPDDAAFCAQLLAAEDQLDSIDQAFTGGDTKSATDTLAADMDVFRKLAAAAPSEIAPAMQDILTALDDAQKALSGGAPDTAALAGMQNMGGDLTALGNYLANNCAAYAN